MSDFKVILKDVRDKLRIKGILGMDSMKHICLYILSRSLTKEKTMQLGIDPKYSWENIVNIYDSPKGREIAFSSFLDEDSGDCLIYQLDPIFDTRDFPFRIEDPDLHEKIIKMFNNIDIFSLDLGSDIFGYIYEAGR